MPARLFGDQAECIPLGYAQDIAFCLIQAPHFAFHDPCVIFRVQIKRLGKSPMLMVQRPRLEQPDIINEQPLLLPQEVVGLR